MIDKGVMSRDNRPAVYRWARMGKVIDPQTPHALLLF